MKFDRYLFVCLNERAPGHPRGCCVSNGANEVFEALKNHVKAAGLATKVRINRAGCMERCEAGPNLLVVPDNVWYSHVKAEDVPEIVEKHLVGGEVVERLKAE